MPDEKMHPKSIKRAFQIGLLIIALPALFINLGLLPLISDEPTRGIVTLEMIFSKDYIHPTINGELYFNKPPLFNWIQAVFIFLTGSMDEWVFRLPTIISIVLLSLLIYFSSRKHLGDLAFIASLSFLVCGRVLFWDSFMGLIDISYSVVTFGSFIWIIHYKEKEKLWLLFMGSYLLAAIGYLMKGIPSIAFQGLSIFSLFIYQNSFKKLLSLQHLAGIVVFIVIVGGYYLIYNFEHPILPVIDRLISESNRLQDTSSDQSWWFHLLEFPLNFLYEFAPVSILLILLFSKKVRLNTFSDPYFRALLVIFLVNIIIYWLSANMRSRYLFMLAPLIFIIVIKAYEEARHLETRLFRVIQYLFLSGSFFISASILLYPFWAETREMNNVWMVSVLLFLIAIIVTLFAVIKKQYILYSLFASLLLARIAFNLYNIPARINSYPDLEYKKGEITAAHISAGYPLYVLGSTPFNHDASFYISRERRDIVTRVSSPIDRNAFYIADQQNLDNFASANFSFQVYYSFTIKYMETQLFLVKIQQ